MSAPQPVAVDARWHVHLGDCVAWLLSLPEASVDAIVCDPPYGLSKPPPMEDVLRAWLDGRRYLPGKLRKGTEHCLAHIAGLAIRDADHADPLLLAEPVDSGVSLSGPLSGVVKLPIDLDDRKQSGDEDVDREEVLTVRDDVLLDDDVSSVAKGGGDLVLDLRPLHGCPACVGECACFALGDDSVARLPVLLSAWTDEAKTAAGVVALAGAEDRAVLALDVRRLTFKLLPADAAVERFELRQTLCPEPVGAGTGTGGLSTPPEPGRIRFVLDAADGALPLHLDLHDSLVERLSNPMISPKGFMGKAWDSSVPGPEVWRECFRVLKPGGHLIAFAGTRTVDLLGIALRLAGFEVRDMVAACQFTGFPKSLDVSKAIDAAAGVTREVVGPRVRIDGKKPGHAGIGSHGIYGASADLSSLVCTAPATPEAAQWSGWGTALKPAYEPAILVRKPLIGTVAQNVLRYGTGALNIDDCRFAPGDPSWVGPSHEGWGEGGQTLVRQSGAHTVYEGGPIPAGLADGPHRMGRWPANLYHCPKPPRKERERGCDGLPAHTGAEAVDRAEGSAGLRNPRAGAGRMASTVRNPHPCVKPVALMRWLCRLVTPPGGLVVDPFTGSGSTGIAALLEGFRFAGAEMEPDYHQIACARIAHAAEHPEEWGGKRKPKKRPKPPAEAPASQVPLFGGAR